MIVLDVEQGSWQWRAARLGIPTTSAFSRIVTPKMLKPGSGADSYMLELLAEWATGKELEEWTSPWSERGKRLEPEARRFLRVELGPGHEVREVGFVYKDEERMVGCSPDGLVYADGEIVAGVEIKCPAAKTHIGYLLDPDELVETYKMQIQGGLWVTGLGLWHACSYYPGMPPVVVPVEPDEEVFAALDEYMPAFLEGMAKQRARLIEMGVDPRLSTDTPEWALPSVDMMPLDDDELEAFEYARRAALESGDLTQAEHDELVQRAVNGDPGDYVAVRAWLRRQSIEAVA